jgi:hypothetical protein
MHTQRGIIIVRAKAGRISDNELRVTSPLRLDLGWADMGKEHSFREKLPTRTKFDSRIKRAGAEVQLYDLRHVLAVG